MKSEQPIPNPPFEVAESTTYTICFETATDGRTRMTRTNDGFDPLQLLGLASLLQYELCEQFKGRITPDIIERQVVNRKS